jgi:beta-barrel assembly-enhancing protease
MRTVHQPAHLFSTAFLFAFLVFAGGTVRGQQPCTVTLAPRIPSAANIFSSQQEQTLGDIEAEWLESNYKAGHHQELAAHLNVIAARILAQFPGELPKVHVILIDTPEAEAFSIGPERIYVTRRMVALARNDDELAGLLGHELGHIQANQNAVIVSKLFHAILGVNAVSDKKDILDKLTKMFDNIDRDRKSLRKATDILQSQEGPSQDEADQTALYASAAAGYSPQAYLNLFERSAGTKGSKGSVLTDYFGSTTSNLRRFREIQNSLRHLPQPCQDKTPTDSTEFRTWQAAVLAETVLARQ